MRDRQVGNSSQVNRNAEVVWRGRHKEMSVTGTANFIACFHTTPTHDISLTAAINMQPMYNHIQTELVFFGFDHSSSVGVSMLDYKVYNSTCSNYNLCKPG